MTETPRPGDDNSAPGEPSSSHEHRPNWGSAYPPPPQGAGYPPPGAYPPPGTYPAPGAYPYAVPPKHSDATTSMVLGIVAIAGAFICALPILISPFAWYMGAKAQREIDASNGALSGRSEASAGKILGIIGTVLMVLAIAGIIALIVLTVTVDDFWDDDYDSYDAVLGAFRQALSVRG